MGEEWHGAIAQTVRIGEGYFGGCTHSSIEAVISDMAAIAVWQPNPPPPDILGLRLTEAITHVKF